MSAPRYDVVPAREIAPGAPDGLAALVLSERPPRGPTVRLYAVGDTGLSGRVTQTGTAEGFDALFAEVTPLLRSGDVVFGNLEATLLPAPPAGAFFVAPPAAAAALAGAGFSIVHVANNHTYDYGATGLGATLAALEAHRLVALGVSAEPVRTDRRGLRIGWLGCGRTLVAQDAGGPRFWEYDEPALLDAVRAARPAVDVLVASVHIGFMYLDYPHPDHKAMADRCLAAGADVVLLHHAHVLQGVEVAPAGGVVCCNLGNFLFDRTEGEITNALLEREQTEGAVFAFDVDAGGVCRAAALPTWVDERCRVRWAPGERGARILERLARLSRDLHGDFAPAFRRQRAERNTGHVLKMLRYYVRHGRWADVRRMFGKVRTEHLAMLARWVIGRLRAPFRRGAYAATR